MLQKHPRSSPRTPTKNMHSKNFFVILVSSVDSLLTATLWEGVKTIAALIALLALLAFFCWLNVYWCFGWC